MQEPGKMRFRLSPERGRELGCELGHVFQMVSQKLHLSRVIRRVGKEFFPHVSSPG
jgi:hypothetical protein